MIYMLAVFFPWLAFFLKGRVFSAIFSFILWAVLCFPMIVGILNPDRSTFGVGLLVGFGLQIVWFFGSFLLWVVLTVWCCLVMHGDQRRKEMEQLIKVIEANSGKSLHYETQQANKTKMWYLAITFLVGLAILAVFFHQKKNTNQAMTQAIAKKAVLKTLKILATRIKEWQHHSKAQNQAQKQQGSRG